METHWSADEPLVVQPVQHLLGCSLLGFLHQSGLIRSWQDHYLSFEGHGYPRDIHPVTVAEEPIRPSVAVVYLSRLIYLKQEPHGECWWSWRHLGGGGGGEGAGGGRVLGDSGSSHCSAETRRGGWTAGLAQRQDRRLWRVEEVTWRLDGWWQEAAWRHQGRKCLVWAWLHCRKPLDWDSQRKLPLECWRKKTLAIKTIFYSSC